MKNLSKITVNGEDFKINNPINITWDSSSNMNDFKTAGVYDIYGERTRQDDNLPILNASSGHSIAAKLIVVASTLQPANNEICVTQFLMLSNRLGGDGNMYVRTYNENNSPAADWWTPWQKLQGIREGYIFTDTVQINPDDGVQQIEGVTGLNNMIDNGIYSGIYTDDPSFQSPSFIDTFTLIVINNYAVAGQDQRLKRTISQLKYAVDAITNQASVKQRTKTDGEAWTEWKDIVGSGGETVIDANNIFELAGEYGLPGIISQYADSIQSGVVYELNIGSSDMACPLLDIHDKIRTHFYSKWLENSARDNLKVHIKQINNLSSQPTGYKHFEIDICGNYGMYNNGNNIISYTPIKYTYLLDYKLENVSVSSDFIAL